MSIAQSSQEINLKEFSKRNRRRFNIVSIVFWVIFVLNYLYLNRILLAATYERFRLGLFVLLISIFAILINQRVVKNVVLVFSVFILAGITIISAWINQISFIQFIAFFRIPIIVYLIYNVVVCYINNSNRANKVLRVFFIIAAFQLPIIALQRYAYDWLPSSLIYTTSLADFGTGTFSGDTAMAFALIGLVVLLLFDNKINKEIKHRWLLAGWLSLTVLFSNSQIQHVTIIVVWLIYILFNIRSRNLIIGISTLIILAGVILLVSTSSLMTFSLMQNTLAKLSEISRIIDGDVNYDLFFSGGHARDAAISYYLKQPIKILGDGPGSVYDTSTGHRTVGGWGHIFTFYAEVGLLGYLSSILIFFVIAFPIIIKKKSLRIRISWVGALMFFAVLIVTFVKYPMGDTVMVFTYCIILVSHQVLMPSRPSIKSTSGFSI